MFHTYIHKYSSIATKNGRFTDFTVGQIKIQSTYIERVIIVLFRFEWFQKDAVAFRFFIADSTSGCTACRKIGIFSIHRPKIREKFANVL